MNTRTRSVTRAEFEWQHKQPVIGSPSLTRLRSALKAAGFDRVRLKLDEDREFLHFTLQPGSQREGLKGERVLKLLITNFRRGGFEVGFEELGVHSTGASVKGTTLTGPIYQVAEHGAPDVEA